MTKFVQDELMRLVEELPRTNPCSADYQMLLRSIECLDAMGQTINSIIELHGEGVAGDRIDQLAEVAAQAGKIKEIAAGKSKVVPFTAPDAPWEEPAPVAEDKEEPTYSAPDVRKALVDARAKGVDIKAILSEFGVTDFRALPAERYGALMKKLEGVV